MQHFPITGFPEERVEGAYYGRPLATHEAWARGDRSLLPLGAVWADSTSRAGSLRSSFASAKSAKQQGANKNTLGGESDASQAGNCGGTGSSRPIGQPIMTMYAGGTKLAVFLTPPSTTIFNACSQAILSLLGSWSWGWRLVSTAGILTGFSAGLLVGLGQRLRPVAGWSSIVLVSRVVRTSDVGRCPARRRGAFFSLGGPASSMRSTLTLPTPPNTP